MAGGTEKRSAASATSTSSRPLKVAKSPGWASKLGVFDLMKPNERATALGSDTGFCVAENITLSDFHNKCDDIEHGKKCTDLESRLCFHMEFIDGKAWIYEIPHAAHDRAAGEVVDEIMSGLGGHRRDFFKASSPRCDNNNVNESYEPDGSVVKRLQRPGAGQPGAADATGNRFPNIIVEVAFIETESHVRRKAVKWLNASNDPNFAVQQVIVIKIGKDPRPTRGNTRAMEAWQYEQAVSPAVNHYDNVASHFVFGVPRFDRPPPSNNVGVTFPNQMVLQIPSTSFYHPANPPAGVPPVIDVDLFYIRRAIEESF